MTDATLSATHARAKSPDSATRQLDDFMAPMTAAAGRMIEISTRRNRFHTTSAGLCHSHSGSGAPFAVAQILPTAAIRRVSYRGNIR
jgi:hypothetical protein